MDYFFAGQIRSYRVQIIRAFSNFSVSNGMDADGNVKLKRVPCRYGDTSKMAEVIIAGNSENKLPSAPFISVYVTSMSLAPERRAAPSLVSTVNVNERAYDSSSQRYTESGGNRYTVKRYMAVPFTMTVNVDFWCSNTNQKEELFEQTQVLFNGMIDIQTSNNPLDWTLFSSMEPTNITWSSRSIPLGTETTIDVMTVEYRIPIWINPPAQVTQQKLIEQVVTNISTGVVGDNEEWSETTLLSRNIHTPDDARIRVSLSTDGLYELRLENRGGTNEDQQQRPTEILSSTAPVCEAGSSFTVNGVPITVPNTSVQDLIAVMKNQFQGSNLNVMLTLSNILKLINLRGGDLVITNLAGTAVESLGFIATTYPGRTLAWWRLLQQYGALRHTECDTGSSEILLLTNADLDQRDADIRGSIALHPVDQNILYWSPVESSWPVATLPKIDAIINPQTVWPNQGLSAPRVGQRYLISDEIATSSAAWGVVQAQPNDIIEYDGSAWIQVFDSNQVEQTTWIKNQYSQKWYQFVNHSWQLFPSSSYLPGEWRIKL